MNAIEYLQSLNADKDFRPNYDVYNGVTAWKFSDLCRRHGYERAVWFAELVRDRVPDIPSDCRLLETYKKFLQLKNDQQSDLTG